MLVHAPERPKVFKMLMGGQRSRRISMHLKFMTVDKIPNRVFKRSVFVSMLTKLFPQTIWKGLTHTTSNRRIAAVAIVDVPDGRLIAFRNGWDSGMYNFVIYYKDKTYYRKNVGGTVELIQILTAGSDNLPLYIGSKFPENSRIVEALLKA